MCIDPGVVYAVVWAGAIVTMVVSIVIAVALNQK